MAIETGFGSPVGPSAGEAGEGSPVSADYALVGESGEGSPVIFTEDAPSLPVLVRGAFQTAASYARYGWVAAYSEDGGALVEMEAAWPVHGPYTVWLEAQDGTLYPDASTGCYSGIATHGDACYANASRRFLRFVFPRCPIGTYNIVVQWETGGTTADAALRSVPRMVPAFTRQVLRYAGVGTWMEKQ